MEAAASLRLRAPAKVNLGLRVLGRRPDGYHELATVLAAVDLWDTLEFEPGGDGVRLECDDPELPTDGSNLVLRAAALLGESLSGGLPGVLIRLAKGIPAGRGLGGGSSDAAATLLGLNRLFGLGLGRFALHRLLARVGMDAPFFLYGGSAFAGGRGEQVFPLARVPALALVLVVPPWEVRTRDAYRGLRGSLPRSLPGEAAARRSTLAGSVAAGSRPGEEALWKCSAKDPFPNDLEASTALGERERDLGVPEMRRLLAAAGAIRTAMSGSGSAAFGVFSGGAAAAAAAISVSRAVSGRGGRAIATRTISRAEHRAALFGRPLGVRSDGAWPSGQAPGFGSGSRGFESFRPSQRSGGDRSRADRLPRGRRMTIPR